MWKYRKSAWTFPSTMEQARILWTEERDTCWVPLCRWAEKAPMAGVMMLLVALMAMPAYAAGGNVSGAIEGTWSAAQGQIKDIVNNVVFPVIDMILAVLLFVKIATAYMDYRKHGQFEFTAPAILFACLLFSLTAPSYIWNIL